MTNTLTAFRQEMVRISVEDLGTVETISALDDRSVTCSGAAGGGRSSGTMEGRFMVRPQAASQPADRVRVVSAFESENATYVHDGPAYADITATSEDLELLAFHPRLFDDAINLSLKRAKYMDVSVLPALAQGGQAWLHQLDWIEQPSDVFRVSYAASPVVSRNRYFDKWHTYSTAGVLTPPDFWTLAGSGATVTRSTAQSYATRQRYTAALTRSGTNATLSQEVGLIEDGVTLDSLRSRTVTAVLVAEASSASQVRIGLNDGVTTTYSSYHTGAGGREELTVEKTLSSSATKLTMIISIEVNGTVYLSQAYTIYSAITDTARRDTYGLYGDEEVSSLVWEQGGGSLPVSLPARGIGSAYKVWSLRGYPEFPEAMVRAGTADALVSDAPLTLIATMALARLYERLAGNRGEDTTRYEQLATLWSRKADPLGKKHIYLPGLSRSNGLPLSRIGSSFAPSARRY